MPKQNSEQFKLQSLAAQFAKDNLNVVLDLHSEEAEEEIRKIWKKCADFGFFHLPVKEECGGLGEDLDNIISIMQIIGSECDQVGIMFAINVHLWACMIPVLGFDVSSKIQEKYLEGFMNGDLIGAHAISEENAGSDVWNMQTYYEEVEGGYKITGIKNYVSNAPFADIYLVYARKKGTKGIRGVSCFIVERNTKNFKAGKVIDKMGMESSPMASIYCDGCVVPKENLLGEIGQGMSIFNYTMEYERPLLFSFQVGLMERQLKKCAAFAKERKQFGKSISEFQAVSHRLADMKVHLEISKLLIKDMVAKKMNYENISLASSIAKLYISDSVMKNGLAAMDIYGALGFTKEQGVEQLVRDCFGAKYYSGTSDIQKNIIACLIEA